MVGAGIDLELLAHGPTEGVLGEHALDGVLHNALRMLLHRLFETLALQTARVTAVAEVLFLESLVARDANLIGIDDDDEIARIDMRGVGRLVLALQDVRGGDGNATENLVGCIDEDPLALDLAGLCVIRLQSFLH